MQPWSTLKNHHLEQSIFQNRIRFAFVVVVFLCLLLLIRLFMLQVVHYDHYQAASDRNRIQIVPLPPTRGFIYDRNGKLLVDNAPNFSLSIIPEHSKDLDKTLHALGKLIPVSTDQLELFNERKQYRAPYSPVHLRAKLTEQEIAVLLVNRHHMPEIRIDGDLVRNYPYDDLFSHSIGYIGRINEKELKNLKDPGDYKGTDYIGKTGLEKFYEDALHGKTGLQKVETDAHGKTLRVLEEQLPEPGKDLYLYLDFNLQKLASDLLGEQRGAIVAIDPKTGGVLAFVSKPGFDPNLFVTGIGQAAYASLRDSHDQPLFNRIIQGSYPPGSTIKPIIGLAGLEYKKTYWSKTIQDPGWFKLESEERLYRDWKREGHGAVNLDKAIYQSCDVYFYQLALSLGVDNIHNFMIPFGFGKRTGIDITPESPGLIPSKEWKVKNRGYQWYPGETLITGIGQGYMLATPLQLAVSAATMANKGVLIEPRLVKSVEDAKQVNYASPVPSFPKIILSDEDNWDLIIQSMEKVMQSPQGTAYWSSGRGAKYRIAGKTGTAQVTAIKQNEEYEVENVALRHRDHSLFIAFAPVDDPQIAISVIVENGGGGSAVAAPLARKMMDAYLLPATQETGTTAVTNAPVIQISATQTPPTQEP